MTPTTDTTTRVAEPFAMHQVRVHDDSVFARARDEMLHLARVYPVDRLLAVFRANAGLDTRGAAAPGTWEDFGHPQEEAWGEHDYPGREHAQTASLLRGHYAGHFLAAVARAAAGEDDPALRAKVDEFVAGLGEVQAALAATGRYSHPGFLAAYGEWQFSRLEDYAPYGEIWAPYYTCHKIMAGLLDAHELVGSAAALEIATAMGHWVHHRLARLEPDRIQKMWSLYIAGEYGGMNETMARLSVLADEPAFLATARLFDQENLLEAGAQRVDILTDMHANQHLPQLIGYVHLYEITGERRYLDAVVGLWDQIVPGRMYAHGGTGESELWGPPQTVAGDIGHRNAETCATYNLLKIARLLFSHTGDAAYMAYYERGVLNQILGSRAALDSDDSPEVTYMFPVHPGALGEFDNVGTCCGGTGLENHVKYQDTIFFRGADGSVLVNLFTSATLEWAERRVRVVQESELPHAGSARLRVESLDGAEPVELTLRIRMPEWLVAPATARVGDVPRPRAAAGAYAEIARTWRPGDILDLELPMAVRAIGTIDDATLQSVEYGPTVLVARSDATTTLELDLASRRLLTGAVHADDAAVAQALRASGGIDLLGQRFEPIWTGADRRYHMYVRAASDRLGFDGAVHSVPARPRADGSTVLTDVWVEPLPATRPAFLDRVLSAVVTARRDGLLSNDEVATALAGATTAQVDGVPRDQGSRVCFGDGAASWSDVGDSIVWTLPAAVRDAPTRPAVAITTPTPAGPTGWYREAPEVVVEAVDLGGERAADLVVEVRVDDGEWAAYAGPFTLADEGVHRVRARATSASGAIGSAVRELSIDTAPPTAHARVRRLGSSVEITLLARDEVSGVERIQWEGDGTFWATFQEAFVRALGDTEQVIEFAATDRAGNEEPRHRLVLPARDGDRAAAPDVTWI
ncbi:beta-L-arabinofuranosidase domain-containing protein [Microbacterium gorillae]|uniref:beta-L-arabinofuranosidase domain-containing protein n=1 Tax=Microbacterium gorillae TaxID=1231063 RepID=UPI00058CA3EA|nr:beta-L-arabinofuranosidase domain-containing protein [Microbacterium gorillae]